MLHSKVRRPQGPGSIEVTAMSRDSLCAEPVSQRGAQAAGAVRGVRAAQRESSFPCGNIPCRGLSKASLCHQQFATL